MHIIFFLILYTEKKYSKECLEKAVSAVKEGAYQLGKPKKLYSLPFNTIRGRPNGSVDMGC
jgi:hypothetical protein